MKDERWRQINELFDAVLEIPKEFRGEFLTEHCGSDDDLRREILALLAADDASETFIGSSAMNMMAEELAEDRPGGHTLIGAKFGVYEIEKPIGSGGMGEVFLAHDTKLNRKVAIKILPVLSVSDPDRIKRFEREARMISALNHPYIVTIHDVGSSNGVNYLATEFVEGETARELMDKGVDLKKTLSIVSQTCEALAAAHKAGIIHRDIKPENIMVRPDGFVKVLDFGLAKLSERSDAEQDRSNYTMKGMIIGTPAYMSPEQISDDRVDHRTDLWSVGVVLYELLTGKNPFKGDSRKETFHRILSENPAPVSELDERLPVELDAILSKALEKDADLSYQTASDLRADLSRIRREIDSSASVGSASATAPGRKKRRWRNRVVAIAATLFLGIVAIGIWFFGPRFWQAGATDWSKATNIQLTDQKGTEFFPALAPDGASFVYASDAGGNFDIYAQRVGGKNPVNLTKDSTADDTEPAFSPDGKQIAFRSTREPKGIYVMGASGENLRRIADFGYQPSWSPNGKEVVVATFGLSAPSVRVGRDNTLWVVNVEIGSKREILKEEATFPSWSPHGSRIAYWFYPDNLGRRDIATIPAAGGEAVVLTKDFGTSNWNPVWSPDGRYLYFVSDKAGNLNFWRIQINEVTGEALSEPEPVNTPSRSSRHLNFSRDGKRMIYVQTDSRSNIQGVGFDSKTETTKGNWFWITSGDREIVRAELSPDGTQFVMRQTRRTQDDIVIVNRDGNNWRDVTNDAAFDRYPRWSPDGKQIAFASDRNVSNEIWICDADGSNLRQITFQNLPKSGSSFPNWSADGKKIIYTNNSQSWLVDLTVSWQDQAAPQRVSSAEVLNSFITWDWSPDGKKIVGVIPGGERVIGVYSLESNTFSRLVEDVDSIPSWLPDSRRFIFEKEDRVYLTDIETKKTKEIFSRQPEHIRSPFVSRDGKLLYYTAPSSESDIWLLDLEQTP